ncbi:MAG: hypothetical protein M3R15_32475 [Acidobacteriota bacterium]|nr:hypothetical protein [Acidobacteriota bacterium]
MELYLLARGLGRASVQGRAFLAVLSAALIFGALLTAPTLRTAEANGDDDHSAPVQSAAKGASAAPIRTAERNVQTEVGQFKVRLRQTPTDPRAGEEAQFAVDLSEQVEGGFGGAGMQPVEGANVTARVLTAAGQAVADKLATHAEAGGSYGVDYAFRSSGEYKIIFDARTSDGRQFSTDFPVSVVSAPTNWLFWLGLAALGLVSAGAIFGYYNSWKRGDAVTANVAARKTVPVAIAALVFFGLGTAALAYFSPPRERRAITHLPPSSTSETSETAASSGDPALGGSGATITIPKESQLLFSIRTEPVTERRITGGLKVAGTVRARPDAQAVISPPVSGRVLFNQGVTIGTVVGRGQRIGTIEQILGAPEQAGLEA